MVFNEGNAGDEQPMHPITLYLTITVLANVAFSIPPNNLPQVQTEVGDTPAKEPTKRSIVPVFGASLRPTAPGPPLPPPGYLPVETGTSMPHGQSGVAPNEIARTAIRRADKAKKPIDRTNTWKRAVGRIKWVMDTVSSIAEVRAIPILPFFD